MSSTHILHNQRLLTALADYREQREARQRWRTLQLMPDAAIDFCSNDYLGLRQHPTLIAAFQQGLARYGVGSGGSALVSGQQVAHHYLQKQLAEWLERPGVVLFSSGFAANMGVMQALAPWYQQVLLDRLCHASLLRSVQLSHRNWRRFAHNDPAAAAQRLVRSGAHSSCLLVTESIFSMDGDAAPLTALQAACPSADLWVDDAHGLGVVGADGRSVAGAYQQAVVPFLTVTFGKAFGMSGAAFLASEAVAEHLYNDCAEVIYSTQFSAAQAQALSAAIKLVQGTEGTLLRQRLQQLRQLFVEQCQRAALPLIAQPSAIQHLTVGSDAAAVWLSEQLASKGFYCRAIRPPTVPEGQARLRVILSARHSETQIKQFVSTLAHTYQQLPTRWEYV